MIIVKNENVVVRKIHGTTFLINIADNFAGDRCALYEVNETGLYIWNQIDYFIVTVHNNKFLIVNNNTLSSGNVSLIIYLSSETRCNS